MRNSVMMAASLFVFAVVLLGGCSSTYVSTKVGGTEYTWQMSLEKSEVLD